MKIKEITQVIENLAPLSYQEDYDNCGLLVGNENDEVSSVLISLDCTEAVLDEAIQSGCNMVISHHPVIFGKGLKKLNGKNYVERTVIKAIKNNIAIYAAHTNLDNVPQGVNKRIADRLGLKNTRILSPKANTLSKLVTFVPVKQADSVRQAIFNAGAGVIGNYSETSFNVSGTGTFKGSEGAKPFVGEAGKMHREQEIRIETIFPSHKRSLVLQALLNTHPYEEVAYDLYSLQNSDQTVGSGMIGDLENEMDERSFLDFLKKEMKTDGIRYTPLSGRMIKQVAVCGGAGSFLLDDALRSGAQVFITGDYKYHQFFDADNRILIADIGHYESEQFTKELLAELINKIFPTFAVRLAKTNTNPVNYL